MECFLAQHIGRKNTDLTRGRVCYFRHDLLCCKMFIIRSGNGILYGFAAYWSVIGLESLSSCQYATNQGNMSLHYNFWTETYANYLSEEYFGAKWLGGPDTHYPAVNISKFNLQRLRVGGRFFY